MKNINVTQKMKAFLDPKVAGIEARLFVTREDGITIYDSIQDKTTTSVAALVSGVWQASEALMGMVSQDSDIMDFRFGFDTSSQGIYLFAVELLGKRYFFGAIYKDCVNPGQLKRQVSLIKEEMGQAFLVIMPDAKSPPVNVVTRDGYLFKDITDEEIDRLFSISGR